MVEGKPQKNLNLEIDQTRNRTQAHCMRGNDVNLDLRGCAILDCKGLISLRPCYIYTASHSQQGQGARETQWHKVIPLNIK